MKQLSILALIVVVGLVAVFGITSAVNAQQSDPPTTPAPGQGWGAGMMGGRGAGRGMMGGGGMMGGRGMMGNGGMMGGYAAQGEGQMHEYMQAELAAKLGISVEDLEAAYTNGQTFWQVASDKGFTTEQAQQMMTDARAVALDKLVAEGAMTQEQADFMKSHMSGAGVGGCGMGGTDTGANTTRGGRSW